MEILQKHSIFSIKRTLLTLLVAMVSFGGFANQPDAHGKTVERLEEEIGAISDAHLVPSEDKEKFNAVEMIMHHISDAHDFHILDWKGHSISMPLPIILYTEKGLVTFMSSEFHHNDHGSVIVEKDGQRFVKNHEHIYYASQEKDAHGSFLEKDDSDLVTNSLPLDFSITKNVFSMMMSAILLLVVFLSVAAAYKKKGVTSAPSGFQNLMETLIIFVRDEIVKPNITASKADKYVPYLLTVFFFILINNLVGLVPFFPFSANLTGNIAFTLTMAVCTLIVTVLSGNKNYWGHIFWMPGVPKIMMVILAPIEVIGIFTKPIALMIRLFANITAGHIIILSLISIIFIMGASWSALSGPLTLFMNVLELLVAFLQAYVFTLLSALFIGQAVDDHH
jgi:F-type H+-transporting ATPase subunit a